jgi:hypothetical protein
VSQTPRLKSSPNPIPRATTPRAVQSSEAAPRTTYASVLASARSLRLAVALLPLGALLGTAAACGGAPPARPPGGMQQPYLQPEPAPSASTSSSATAGTQTGAENAPPAASCDLPALAPIPPPAAR